MKDRKSVITEDEGAVGQKRAGTGPPDAALALLRSVPSRSGKDLLRMIGAGERPQELVRSLSTQDFYWFIKKLAQGDLVPVLKMASLEQWQYILDLSVWKGDRLEKEAAFSWIDRFADADAPRLSEWLFFDVEGQYLAPLILSKMMDIVIADEENNLELPEGFFTIDNTYYIGARDPDTQRSLKRFLKAMADYDMDRYQHLLACAPMITPDEIEEELYRLRNSRLAEEGFVPREEALVVYQPLEPAALKTGSAPPSMTVADTSVHAVPLLPFLYAKEQRALGDLAAFRDPTLRDRICFEFASLCNMIVSAEGRQLNNLDDLQRVWSKASGYLRLVTGALSGSDATRAEQLFRANPLLSLFRVAYSLVLSLRWEAERWAIQSWYRARGFPHDFWGERWGGMLEGIFAQPPQLFTGNPPPGTYRDFATAADLDACRRGLPSLVLLDRLLRGLTDICALDESYGSSNGLTCYQLLFPLWIRRTLGYELSFAPLSMAEVKEFFRLARGRSAKPPYRMEGWENIFVNDMSGYILPTLDDRDADMLNDALLVIWGEFRDEYQEVPASKINRRYGRFFSISAP